MRISTLFCFEDTLSVFSSNDVDCYEWCLHPGYYVSKFSFSMRNDSVNAQRNATMIRHSDHRSPRTVMEKRFECAISTSEVRSWCSEQTYFLSLEFEEILNSIGARPLE